MPLYPPLEPLADSADAWVLVVEKLRDKIKDPTLSFYKYLVAKGYTIPKVYERWGPSATQPMLDPPLSECPAVTLDAYNTDFVDDRGSGDERWFFSVAVAFKIEVKNQDARVPIRATHELLRTIFHKWRGLGPSDPMFVPGLANYEIEGNIAPTYFSGGGILTARTRFGLRFTFSETILG